MFKENDIVRYIGHVKKLSNKLGRVVLSSNWELGSIFVDFGEPDLEFILITFRDLELVYDPGW